MTNHPNTKLERQIENPLEYVSIPEKRHYYKRAEDLARKSLVAKNSKLVSLENERILRLDNARSRFLKNFTFLLVGSLFLAAFLFLLYLYLTGKLY